MFIYIHNLSYYKLVLYFNLCLSVMLDSLSCTGLHLVTYFDDSCDPVKLMERNVSCLLYVDDLVLISQLAIGLQNSLID